VPILRRVRGFDGPCRAQLAQTIDRFSQPG
jgi:hypothetical protein